jgi:hypothetical protein
MGAWILPRSTTTSRPTVVTSGIPRPTDRITERYRPVTQGCQEEFTSPTRAKNLVDIVVPARSSGVSSVATLMAMHLAVAAVALPVYVRLLPLR